MAVGAPEDRVETVAWVLPDGTFTDVDDVFCQLFGKKREELVGSKWFPLAVGEDLAKVRRALKELSVENPVVVVENRSHLAEGRDRWMQFTNRGFFDADGSLKEIRCVGLDITERKLAEQALRESNERWKFAIEGAGDGVFDWDVRTGRVVFSKRWKEMLGYEEDEIEDRFEEWQSRLHPEDRELAVRVAKEHIKRKREMYTSEFRMRCKDGSWKWILARAKTITRDRVGRPLRLIGTHTDISAWKAIKAREAQNLKLVAEGAPQSSVLSAIVESLEAEYPVLRCAILLLVEEGTRIKVGAAPQLPRGWWKVMEGCAVEDVGPCLSEILRSAKRLTNLKVRKPIKSGLETAALAEVGLEFCVGIPLLSADGRALGVLMVYGPKDHSPRAGEAATISGGASLCAVALQRWAEEDARRETEERFRAVFDQAAVGVSVIDSITGRFLSVNRRACEIARLSEKAMLERTFLDICHPEDNPRDLREMEKLKAGLIQSFAMEKRYVHDDGSMTWVNVTVSPMWRRGEVPQRHIAVVEEITARKTAEENYRREVEYNRALVEHTSAYIVALNQKGEFTHVNAAFVSAMGMKAEALLGRNPWELGMMEGGEMAASKQRFEKLLRGEGNSALEMRLKSGLGLWHVVELRSTVTRALDGSVDRIIVTGTDVTERNRLQQELLNIVEQEQARLGHDLHDGVGQTMTGIITLLGALEEELEGRQRDDAARIRQLLQESVAEVRRMSHGLSPTSVKNRGLDGGLELLAETVRLNYRTPCSCEIDPAVRLKDKDMQAHLFRICQEAVNNALRHGAPTRIQIFLKRLTAQQCVLRVEDNGRGLSNGGANRDPGIGLRVMEYRAHRVGAHLEVRNRRGRGVRVSCTFPCEAAGR